MKTKNTTVGTIPKSNIKIVERGKIDTHNTQIHDLPLSWIDTDTLNKKKWGRCHSHNYNIVIYCLSTKLAPLRSKSKDVFAWNQDNVSK